MLAIQKLVHNGSSTQVTIPRAMLNVLGWMPGSIIAVEYQPDHSLKIRKPRERDFQAVRFTGKMLIDTEPPKP